VLRRQFVRLIDNNPRFQRWIGFVMLAIALGAVMMADAFGFASVVLAGTTVYLAVWLFQKADDHPERLAARDAEVARIERELDD
jgi:acyl dehydratase